MHPWRVSRQSRCFLSSQPWPLRLTCCHACASVTRTNCYPKSRRPLLLAPGARAARGLSGPTGPSLPSLSLPAAGPIAGSLPSQLDFLLKSRGVSSPTVTVQPLPHRPPLLPVGQLEGFAAVVLPSQPKKSPATLTASSSAASVALHLPSWRACLRHGRLANTVSNLDTVVSSAYTWSKTVCSRRQLTVRRAADKHETGRKARCRETSFPISRSRRDGVLPLSEQLCYRRTEAGTRVFRPALWRSQSCSLHQGVG